jgi:hypothetical protein
MSTTSRVWHEDYGTGTVTGDIDGKWALVLFDGGWFPVSVHVDDLRPVSDDPADEGAVAP